MVDTRTILKELEKSGKREANLWLLQLKQHQYMKLKNAQELLESSKKAVKYFIINGFWRGRQDELSSAYVDCFLEAFEEVFNDVDLTSDTIAKELDKLVERYEQKVGNIGYKVNKNDVEMIRDALNFVKNHPNPINYIVEKVKEGKVLEVYKELDTIKEWGLKLSSMLLRTIVIYFNLENYLKEEDYAFLFPIDTHVRQIVKIFFPETKSMADEEIMKHVSRRLKELKLSPLYVNVGLWLIHAKAPKVMEALIGRSNQ